MHEPVLANSKPSLANLIAQTLAGSWRPAPAPSDLSPGELDVVMRSLLESGGAALAWWRLRLSGLQSSPEASELQQAYRLHTLQAVRHERDLARVLKLLQTIDVEPVLVKGWAVARLYPESGLRPYGDIDLCVHPNDYDRAARLLKSGDGRIYDVDLHRGFKTLDKHPWGELISRSQLVEINGSQARVLCPEDHLRVLCFHFLREGAWRPLWLCDIAVVLETRSADFDWELCLGRNRKRWRWFACVITLTHLLLNANVAGVPPEIINQQLPRWFLPCVLKEWETPSMPRRHLTPMTTFWRAPIHTLKGLRFHWPNAIEGTVGSEGAFNELPRLPFQLGSCFIRTMDFVRKLPHKARS
jgi:hypothetical protein